MVIYLPELICVIGLIIYLITTNAKASTIGLHMFWVGLLASLIVGVPHP